MIKLTQLIKELGINKPEIKLIPGKKYQVWDTLMDRWEILEFMEEFPHNGTMYFKTDLGNFGANKKYFIKNNWVKPYNEKINELSVNNPGLTAEKVYDQYLKFFKMRWDWDKIKHIFQPYIDKNPKIGAQIGIDTFLKSLPQPELNKLYRELKQLDTYGK